MTSYLDNAKFQQNELTGEIQGGVPLFNGGKDIKGGGMHKFENFIVPMGLVVENRTSLMHKIAMTENGYNDVVSESMFDNLYKKVAK